MKKLILSALILFTITATQAQNVDLRRKIEVSGTAETEVTPDIIYFSISLKEYMDGRNRVDITTLENQLIKAVADAGVAKEDLTINNISGYTTYQKKKDPNFLASKQYRVKFRDLNKINQILGAIDPKGIQSTYIESYDYSKIEDLKKELKLKALIAARDKAAYLLTGIGQKTGDPISITEIDNGNNFAQPRNVMYMAKASNADVAAEQDIDFKKIKLTFQVNAVFEIVK
ncbi:SIMPL domain-containing protein [Mucilaginibacter sp. HMF5004]|uniref:SIMPL domain-containing protein n=1 Tax=Mucilaginibacter rivuli TaxID=2857527 RepID=UPI001C6038C1|nr:SIMPL domain-containing protein [Mucilaginibacter rivuli]MBW4891146.1 SIMPL domain-containing protein [Mucilaginibacter rivuli]